MPSLLESVEKNSAWKEKGADTGHLIAIIGIGLDPAKRAMKRIDNLITLLADGMSSAEEDAVIVIKVDEMCRELLKNNLEPFKWCTFDLYVPDDDVMISPQAKLVTHSLLIGNSNLFVDSFGRATFLLQRTMDEIHDWFDD